MIFPNGAVTSDTPEVAAVKLDYADAGGLVHPKGSLCLKSGLVSHANGAVVPVDAQEVQAARVAHTAGKMKSGISVGPQELCSSSVRAVLDVLGMVSGCVWSAGFVGVCGGKWKISSRFKFWIDDEALTRNWRKTAEEVFVVELVIIGLVIGIIKEEVAMEEWKNYEEWTLE